MTAYRIEHSNSDVYCVEAYGCEHHPVFVDREKAESFMWSCVDAWPADATDARRMYRLDVYESMEAALSDGHGQMM